MLSISMMAKKDVNGRDSTLRYFPKTANTVYIDTSLFLGSWDNRITHVDSVDLSRLTDSIFLTLTDDHHPHFVLPIAGEVRDNFRWRTKTRHHNGVDIALNKGDTVYAAFDGLVRYAKFNTGGYGNLVIIRHYNGLETYYGHFSDILTDTNVYVKAGMPIGLGGSTGRSSGPHLHFEVRYLGNPLNPEEIIDWQSASLTGYEFIVHRDLFKHKIEKAQQAQHAFYKVKKGDTLYSIARKNNTSVSTICRLSSIKASSTLQLGQTIRVK